MITLYQETSMEDFLEFFGAAVVVTLLLFFAAVISGTLAWLVWPVAVPAAFPGLVASGTLAANLTWWQAVCLTWLAGCLVKSSLMNQNNSSKQ
jgi:phosphotransferase system  glucose/maltose/N-acetylglucosamine-specific IIC component